MRADHEAGFFLGTLNDESIIGKVYKGDLKKYNHLAYM